MGAHGIPDLELDLFGVDIDHASSKLNSDRKVMHWLEALVRELEEETRFSNTCTKNGNRVPFVVHHCSEFQAVGHTKDRSALRTERLLKIRMTTFMQRGHLSEFSYKKEAHQCRR